MTRRMLQQGYAALWEIPMWVFLWIGLAVVAAVLLIGPYLEVRQMRWQRQYIQLQASRLQEQRDAYQQMLVSLDQQDPVLLQRLAFHYLHLKPKGVQLVGSSEMGRAGVMFTSTGTGIQPRFVAERSATVDQWLYRPMPVIGQDIPAYFTLDTLLPRLATGPQRLLVTTVGGLCILLGLIPLSRLARRPSASAPLGSPASVSALEHTSGTMLKSLLTCDAVTTGPSASPAPPVSDPVPATVSRPAVTMPSQAVAPPPVQIAAPPPV